MKIKFYGRTMIPYQVGIFTIVFLFCCITGTIGQTIPNTPLVPRFHFHQPSHIPFRGEGDSPTTGESACPNSDFSQGNFNNWVGHYGSFNNPAQNLGFVQGPTPPARHLIIPAPGTTDTYGATGGGPAVLNTVYGTEPFSARLGNDNTGAQAEQLSFDITIGPTTDFFIYRYAVVLNDNNHDPDEQPSFEINIFDKDTGLPYDPVCGYYYVYAQPGLEGWYLSELLGGNAGSQAPVYWKDWTTVGLAFDESDYGRSLTIVFTTKDCQPSGHFGYAYISAFCTSLSVTFQGCEGSNQVVMTGPEGFAEYEWTGPYCPTCTPIVVGTGQTITINNAVTGDQYRLKLISFYNYPNCVIEKVTSTVAFTQIETEFSSSINCIGNASTFTDISVINQNETDDRVWDFGDGSPPQTVTTNTVSHIFALAGTYTVSLTRSTTDPCTETITHEIVVADIPPTLANLPPGPEKHICSGSPAAVALEFSQAGATGSWTSAVTSGTATVTNDPPTQTGLLISDVIVNAGPADAVVTYTITPRIGDCIGLPEDYDVIVHPIPDVNVVLDQVFCNTAAAVETILGSPVAGATYAWTNSSTEIGLAASGTGNVTAFTATNTGTTPITATISVIATANDCPGPPMSYDITINPTPTVTDNFVKTYCNNNPALATTITGPVTGTTYTWTNTNTTIGLAAAGTGTIPAFTATNTGTTPVTATIAIIPVANNCTGTTLTYDIVVNPTPTVDLIADQSYCNFGTVTETTVNGPVAGSAFTWTNSNTNIGLTFGGDAPIPGFTATNPTNNPLSANIIVVPVANNCTGTSRTYQIVVNPTEQVNDILSQEKCNGLPSDPVTFSTLNNVGTTTYTWTNSNTNIGLLAAGTGNIPGFNGVNTGLDPVQATITVFPHFTNGTTTCEGGSKTFTYTINPDAVVDDPGDQAECNGLLSLPVDFTSQNIGGTTTYTWTNSNTNIGLSGTGTGNIPAFNVVNTGYAPITGTIAIAPHFNNGTANCEGTAVPFDIVVNPDAHVDKPGDQTLCNGFETNPVTFTTLNSVGTMTYTWTNDHPEIGLAATGTGHIALFTATNTSKSPILATITVTPAFSNLGKTCNGTSKDFTILVNPTAELDQPDDQVVCNGESTDFVDFVSQNLGGTMSYTWTNSNTTIGLIAMGTGPIPVFPGTNTGDAPVISTITVTPHFFNGTPECDGPVKTFTYTINPTAQVNKPDDQEVCDGLQTDPVVFSTTNLLGTMRYEWTNDAPGIGLASSGTGDIAGFTVTNSTTDPVVAHITITPYYTFDGKECDGPQKTFTITVNPTPHVDLPDDQVFCNGDPTLLTDFTSSNGGGTMSYTWTNSNTTTGLASAGTGAIPVYNATNTSVSPVVSTITVWPHFTNLYKTCDGPPETFTITINPTAAVNSVAEQFVCNGGQTTEVEFSTTNQSGSMTYEWTNSNTTIGLGSSGTGTIPVFNVTNNGPDPQVATITVTPNFLNEGLSCDGPVMTFDITVNPTPRVDDPSDQVVCDDGSTSNIHFTTTNSGGASFYTWENDNPAIGLSSSGTGDIPPFPTPNNGFGPIVGNITVTPHFTLGTATCDGPVETFSITVNPTAHVEKPDDQVVCNGEDIAMIEFLTQNTGGNMTYTWINSVPEIGLVSTGTGTISVFSAVNTGLDPVVASIEVTPWFEFDGTQCTGPAKTFTITVNPTAHADLPNSLAACHGKPVAPTVFTSDNGLGITTYTWTNDNASIGLASLGTGDIAGFNGINTGSTPVTANIEVIPRFEYDGHACFGPPKTFTITVNPLPVPTITGAPTVCLSSSGLIYFTEDNNFLYQWGISAGGVITDGPGTKEVTVTWNTLGAQSLNINYTDDKGCTATGPTTYNVMVQELPDPQITVGENVVCDEQTVMYETQAGATTYEWVYPMIGASLISGGGPNQNFLELQWVTPNSYNITINHIIGVGCTAASPKNYPVTVNPNPTPDILVPQDPICGLSSYVYKPQAPPVPGNTYAWSIVGGTPLNGANYTITVTWGNAFPVSVDLVQTAHFTGVDCPTSATTYIPTFKPWPVAATDITGPANVCHLWTGQVYSVPPVANSIDYTWTYSGTGASITNNGSTISINFSANATSGDLIVKGHNECGFGPVSPPYHITVNSLPIVSYTTCNEPVTTKNAKPFILKGGSPYGATGTYHLNNPSATPLPGNVLNPGDPMVFTGSNTIYYTYTDANNCKATAQRTISVLSSNSGFQCFNLFTDPRDNNVYHTVPIGTQCWMQENLRYGGTTTPFGEPQTDNCLYERNCLSGDPNCTANGGYYQWDELMQYDPADKAQGFCPPGWHIPNESEWETLIDYVSGSIGVGIAGSPLKDLKLNTSLQADPAGLFYLNTQQSFTSIDEKAALYWTSSWDATTKKAVARGLHIKTPSVSRYESSRANAFPVRCLKD